MGSQGLQAKKFWGPGQYFGVPYVISGKHTGPRVLFLGSTAEFWGQGLQIWGPVKPCRIVYLWTPIRAKSFRISKNESWNAHLDYLGFPKMHESSLCGDKCGRKRDAMDPSKGGTDGRTDRPKSSTLIPSFHGGQQHFSRLKFFDVLFQKSLGISLWQIYICIF